MHPEDIKASLRKCGHTMTSVARPLAVTRQAVALVIEGRMTSLNIARAVAQATGVPASRLWPGKYPSLSRPGRPAERALEAA